MLNVVESAAQKDFREKLPIIFLDEMGRLSESINKMSGELAGAMKNVARAASDLTKHATVFRPDRALDGQGIKPCNRRSCIYGNSK
ncbi:hypothetical protein JZK55_01330 [Dissulfurispira thermophila]|uniref:HAMP domain-containing protein n=1 Tax=Dissulfurispira thermophila TaxID=2715679 RepID=A0A7G1GZB7_9BACT|nr:HAMP domain-containing protein [Dissulfurispira thermophila]BCB95211.1 hypothetical protein JZK55_01330 [Dissulfurispira thermophila]